MYNNGYIKNGIFFFPIKIYFEDTDAGGIVYHPNFLKYAERARTELFCSFGFNHEKFLKEKNSMFVVNKAEIEYLLPAHLGNNLIVQTSFIIKKARILFNQDIYNSVDKLLVKMLISVACVNQNNRATRIPQEFLKTISEIKTYE